MSARERSKCEAATTLAAVRVDPIPMIARLRRAREMGIGPAPGGPTTQGTVNHGISQVH
jgi:hypothetical protein